ncbi:Basement membrane-specific heparan sulfate proteoglycan core protein [Myotis brandtii]|uniref:Basement membrane-specific heparan sulfate proteoglycan core protein n=1 Tax=Myotis brandtii TaxID=109478 RepID=S7ML63_MYOBR|nr:Basement membrane-specific heparan sulfate proteoglycan core protein [Myotis brandtii]
MWADLAGSSRQPVPWAILQLPALCLQNNVVGRLCNECITGSFHLSGRNPEGCLKCFCMGVSRQCTSSSWSRAQVHGSSEAPSQFSLTNAAGTHTTSMGISSPSPGELVFSSFHSLLSGPHFWNLPSCFRGDKVTSYGGELRFTVTQQPQPGSLPLHRQPLVVLQGNGIVLEHHSSREPSPGQPSTFTVPFREVSNSVPGAFRRRRQAPCFSHSGVSIPGCQENQPLIMLNPFGSDETDWDEHMTQVWPMGNSLLLV